MGFDSEWLGDRHQGSKGNLVHAEHFRGQGNKRDRGVVTSTRGPLRGAI
jgi:hypothetical protein